MTQPSMTLEQGEAVAARKRRRRRLVLWSLPVVLIAALFSAKTLSAAMAADQAAGHYASKDYEAAANAARAQLFLNIFEQWKAHFNLGDAYVGLGVLDDAQKEFETALELASGADECTVRVNLALLFELRGDNAADAGAVDEARTEYDAALAVIAAADEGCFPPPEESESEKKDEQDKKDGDKSDEQKNGEALSETGDRVQEKKDGLGEAEPADGDPQEGEAENPAEPSTSQVEQVREQLAESNKERSDEQTADRSQSSHGGEFADKPW